MKIVKEKYKMGSVRLKISNLKGVVYSQVPTIS